MYKKFSVVEKTKKKYCIEKNRKKAKEMSLQREQINCQTAQITKITN